MLSLILPVYNSERRVEQATATIIASLEKENIPFEILIIDDGSADRSCEIARQLARADERIRFYRMSRNFTTPYVNFAGASLARGACLTSVHDDLQRPMETVIALYRKWEQGHKVVIPYRASRNDHWMDDIFSNLYYRVMNRLSDVAFPPGGADGFLIDREVIDILTHRIHPIHTSVVTEILRLGFDPAFIPYNRVSREGKSRWTWRKKVRLAKDTFFASSSFPIRAITYMGLGISLLCLLALPLLIYARFFAHSRLFGFAIPGWTTIIALVAFFNGLVLLSLGVVAEYIWRIYEEVKGRPGYIVRKEENEE